VADSFLDIATGRSTKVYWFFIPFMFVVPVAVFTDYVWLDHIGWAMTLIMGFFIFITGIVTLQEARASKTWPQTIAKLKSASLGYRSGSKGGLLYYPVVKVEFKVDGQSYSGTEYDFSASAEQKYKAEQKLQEIKQAHPLWIYYNPNDPAMNVIHPGVSLVHFLRLILGLGIMVIVPLSWLGIIQYR